MFFGSNYKDDLWKLYQKFEELSSILKVDYDGFEVLIDGEENQQEFLPFEDFLNRYLILKRSYLIMIIFIYYS